MTNNTQIHDDSSHSWLGTDTLIKGGVDKLVLLSKLLLLVKGCGHANTIYNRANSVCYKERYNLEHYTYSSGVNRTNTSV